MKNHPLFAGVRVGLVLIALCGLAAPGHAQSKPETKPESTANEAKAAPVIARLEKAIAEKDKFGAEYVLAELEALIPSDGRLAGLRERVAAVQGPKKNLTVDLGGGVTMDFVLIRPGSFTMGSDKSNPGGANPTHRVTRTQPFYLGTYEVTQEQWEQVMGSNPSNAKGAKNPVEQVSWTDCQSFVAKLQEKLPDQPFRLPTEAEWEYACRAGTTGDYCYGDDEDSLAEYAWYSSNANDTTHPVGEKKPNAWGVYDMHGNVWEWCADRYGDYPATAVVDPQGASSGSFRVYRGGGWFSDASNCRVAFRGYSYPTNAYHNIGFRIAETTTNEAKAAPVIARLDKAIAEQDKFGAEDVLAELEALIPSAGRLAGLRERVAAVPEPKKNLTVDLGGGVTMDFVLIRPGSFTMGSDKSNPGEANVAHKVTLTQPFYLGKYEVTQEQWEQVMGSNPSNFKGAKNPVEKVSWTDCQSFVAKLKEKLSDQTFRLPTEAKWEYACRAGSEGDYCYGDEKGSLAEYAWYDSNAKTTTHPVGEKKPNTWGLYDMHGNVFEWCADWYGDYPATAVVDPQGASSGSGRVFRGGDWGSYAGSSRAANRASVSPGRAYPILGFRMARSSVP